MHANANALSDLRLANVQSLARCLDALPASFPRIRGLHDHPITTRAREAPHKNKMSFLIARSGTRGINGFPQGKTTHTPNNRKTEPHDQDRHLSDAL